MQTTRDLFFSSINLCYLCICENCLLVFFTILCCAAYVFMDMIAKCLLNSNIFYITTLLWSKGIQGYVVYSWSFSKVHQASTSKTNESVSDL